MSISNISDDLNENGLPVRAEGENTSAFEACWNYILKLYSAHGVSDACLLLQNKANVDVSLLLVVTYFDCRRNFRVKNLAELDEKISSWRETAIQPLRNLRQNLKKILARSSSSITTELYETIKRSELLAEKAEIETLIHFADRLPKTVTRQRSTEAAISDTVAFFANSTDDGRKALLTDEVRQAISVVAVQA
ncbi:MAG TPA: TIGR02444 family protein [Afipia sp.]